MPSSTALSLQNVSKRYEIFRSPQDRLKHLIIGRWKPYGREFWALRDVSLTVQTGEVIGLVGCNGAGKSTLLQLVCQTLTPSHGTVAVHGRIAALLELGAGFNPEFSGRENVYLNAAILGLSKTEIDAKFDEIVEFSGIAPFIDQPVKTYSSRMYVRLAFSVAIHVDPDILVVDEALSVGDGVFARKSFDKIMALRAAGKTILFCSHSMYQVEAICNRAIWLDKGTIRMCGTPAEVIPRYTAFLEQHAATQDYGPGERRGHPEAPVASQTGTARLTQITGRTAAQVGRLLTLTSGQHDLTIEAEWVCDPQLPPPSLGIGLITEDGRLVTSAGTHNEGITIPIAATGRARYQLVFPALALLKGHYWVSVFLFCERGIHIYDYAERVIELRVSQTGLTQGVVELPHRWGMGEDGNARHFIGEDTGVGLSTAIEP